MEERLTFTEDRVSQIISMQRGLNKENNKDANQS